MTSYSSNWFTLLLLHVCTSTPLVLCCDQFDRGSRQVKQEPIDLVTDDYDVTLCQRIIFPGGLQRAKDRSKIDASGPDECYCPRCISLCCEVDKGPSKNCLQARFGPWATIWKRLALGFMIPHNFWTMHGLPSWCQCDAINWNESGVNTLGTFIGTFSWKPTKIGWLVPELQSVDGLTKQ